MRRLAFLLLLSSCGGPPPAVPDRRIDCRPQGAAAFAPVCSVETSGGEAGPILTIRKPDGGFRRLRVTADGSGVAAADGAERAQVTILPGNLIEVEIGGDRFRLPARVRTR